MRYLTIIRAPERALSPDEHEIARMEAFLNELLEAGTLITTEGCTGTDRGALVRRSHDSFSVTDGPFTEAKEVVGGFALLEVASKEEAIEISKRFLEVSGEAEGECEIRELYPTPPQPVVDFQAKHSKTAASA